MTPTPTLHAQVLALRRTHSARAVAQALSIPLGTVKAISSRAGRRFGRRCILAANLRWDKLAHLKMLHTAAHARSEWNLPTTPPR